MVFHFLIILSTQNQKRKTRENGRMMMTCGKHFKACNDWIQRRVKLIACTDGMFLRSPGRICVSHSCHIHPQAKSKLSYNHPRASCVLLYISLDLNLLAIESAHS